MNRKLLTVLTLLTAAVLACSVLPDISATEEPTPEPTNTPGPTATSLPPRPVEVGEANPNEPVFVSGTIPFTSPFFVDSLAEPFVLLEDQGGFVARDFEFEFPLVGQAIGPVDLIDDETLSFSLALPSIPQGTPVDVDNDGETDAGVQVFAVAYWSNTWGGPFLEPRDGYGWSGAYASTEVDPNTDGEIIGGHYIIWAPDDEQAFPVGFGDDGLLFTEDDPVEPVPAGYSIVDLNQEPFNIYKEAEPEFELIEGSTAVNDYSDMSYVEAFNALYDKIRLDYPFTEDKNIDWDALYATYAPQIEAADSPAEFYVAMLGFTNEIPDGHIGGLFNSDVFFSAYGGGFGLVLEELSDGTVIATQVLPNLPAADAGIERGAEIIEWDGLPVSEAIDAVDPNVFGPVSTDHTRRINQVLFLTHIEPDTRIEITFQNPDGSPQTENVRSTLEVDSLLAVIAPSDDILNLPVEGHILPGTGIGYIKVSSFSDDYNLTARLFERYMEQMIDNEVPGLILDIRENGGGSGSLAFDFAGFFFEEGFELSQRSYYNWDSGEFEYGPSTNAIEPAPTVYTGPVAILIGPDCVSACEGFAYALTRQDRSVAVGHTPTAGAYGEVGRGQYDLPDDMNLQIPTGRPETPDGELLIEGTGVRPEVSVPITAESALGEVDSVLNAAVNAVQRLISEGN